MTTLSEEETEKIACAINHYLQPQYSRITDIYSVIETRQEIEPGIWAYYCPCQTIYLDDDAYAVNCGRQYVEKIYYNPYGEALLDENYHYIQNPDPSEYASYTAKVYYDPRDPIPALPPDAEGDTSITNVMIYLGEYEWQRNGSGGGGVRG
jgi:hypothetical protein